MFNKKIKGLLISIKWRKILKDNNGIITTKEVKENSIDKRLSKTFLKEKM